MHKKLAIIGGGRMASIFAGEAHKMGLEVHCFSPYEGIAEKTSFDVIHPIDIFKKDLVVNECQTVGISGVVATTELTIAIASYVAEKMHLNGLTYEIASVITDKYRNRLTVKKVANLSQPKFAEVKNAKDILNANIPFPLILKPTSKGGKRGISVVYKESELAAAFKYAEEDSGGAQTYIAEEFIDHGMECSVESLSFHGKHYIIQVTQKTTSGPPHCVELGHQQPADLSCAMREKVENVIRDALTEVGINNGPCHTEIKIKNDKVYLIEFNARPGGDHIAHPLTELSTGYPYIKGAIEIALDTFNDMDMTNLLHKYAGVFFISSQTRQLKPIFDNCEKFSWCYQKHVVSEDLKPIIHNDGFNVNYFIYNSCEKVNFDIISATKIESQ